MSRTACAGLRWLFHCIPFPAAADDSAQHIQPERRAAVTPATAVCGCKPSVRMARVCATLFPSLPDIQQNNTEPFKNRLLQTFRLAAVFMALLTSVALKCSLTRSGKCMFTAEREQMVNTDSKYIKLAISCSSSHGDTVQKSLFSSSLFRLRGWGSVALSCFQSPAVRLGECGSAWPRRTWRRQTSES